MRGGLTCYDEESRTPASTDDDSCISLELDLLNPRYRSSTSNRKSRRQRSSKSTRSNLPNLFEASERNSNHRRCFASYDHVETKLLDKDTKGHRASSLQHFPSYGYQKKYEPQVTFVAEKSSSGEDLVDRSLPKLCTKGKSTPRIIRAIRRNSRKFEPEEDRSESPERPRPGNSKSSVVVLYHGKSTAAAPAYPEPPLRATQSERVVARGPSQLLTETVQPLRQQSSSLAESPEDRSLIYPIERRKATLRRRRRLSRRRGPLNVHIYQDGRAVASLSKDHRVLSKETQPADRRSDPSRYSVKSAKNLIRSCEESTTRQEDDSDDPDRGRGSNKHWELDRTFRERCRPTDKFVSKLMARSSLGKDGDSRQRKNEAVCPNLAYLMQQMHSRPRERGDDRAFISVNDGDDDSKRVFPFQATPSGNLKIVPNQVVFESKKVSVLVADPRHTKVNVKAELNRPGNELAGRFSEPSARPRLVDLPPGVSSSTINRLQAQKSFPPIGDASKSTMHAFKSKFGQTEMEQNQQTLPSMSCQAPLLQEVPLSALGFTSDLPIDWDNIILPEKTDLYQELARRITNYKNADCIVRIGVDEFHCHLLVLQSYSAFFDEKNCKEIDLTESDVSSKAFATIYDWMISSQNESCQLLHRDNILEVFIAAQYLCIKELEEQCWAFIDNDELFTEDTAFLLYLEAKKIKNIAVMELMLPRIMKFFLMLVSTKDFLELSVDELCLLLKSNYICVNSEMEVLMSAVRWLMHDWDNRKHQMLEVMKCIRFGLIAPWQLVDVKRNPENPEFMELMSFPEVQKMVDDGLAFVIIKYWYGNQTEDYHHWIELLGLSEPTNRNWAGEDKNYVTYREFLLYLEEYQRTKISELRNRKTLPKTTPPNSPPHDYLFPPSRTPNNYAQSSGDNDAVRNDAATHSMHSKAAPQNYLPLNMPLGLMMPPKLMNEYLERRKGRLRKVCFKVTRSRWMEKEWRILRDYYAVIVKEISRDDNTCKLMAQNDRTSNAKDGNTVTLDTRSTGIGESTKAPSRPSTVEKHGQEHCQRDANLLDDGKLDYESRQEKNAPDVCRCQQRESNLIFSARKQQARCRLPRDPEARADSGKSEEEAATTIQAVYRGYKARRRFHEIKKSTLEEKRNIKKVAELLAIPMGEPVRNLEPIRTSNNSANQMKNEETPWTLSSKAKNKDQRCAEDLCERLNERVPSYLTGEQRTLRVLATPTRPRNALKTIRTIKSPVFFSNHDERTSSFSDNTDTEEPISPQTDVKSTTTDFDDDAEHKEQAKHSKTVQVRASNGKRPLPQRISSSILGSNADRYFSEQSLFFPDRESILVFGGADPHKEYGRTGNISKDIYRFKPAENLWQFAGEIPQPRHHHSVAYLRGRVYVAGGKATKEVEDKLRGKSTSVASVWSYDPTTRTWFDEPDMLTARMDFGLVVSHGKMYAIGGQDRNGMALRTVEAFDPSDSRWREMQPMQTARVGPASVKYRDLIWVAGGMTKSKKEFYTKDVECYNPIENLWLKAVPLRSPRCFASFYVVSDCLYVIGGVSITETGAQSIDSIDTWDRIDCVWKEQANMSIPRHGHAVGSIGEQLFIIGGITTMFPKTLNSVECYCCDIGKWMKGVVALPYSICGHGTVSLPPANLLINHQQL
ncbi:uncharacterized protein LOC122398442 [Colletes gigas]|uniref:uncharacterized protein LOC122398442 n=1 Tax=Colletes gigas TaxID=935657 RepID=UPI001C9A9EBF|nr:uncharacterized protein LOC122398442 [Colletes gigas]